MEIKNCAHCGGRSLIWKRDRAVNSYAVQCETCGIKTEPCTSRSLSIDAWNCRVEQDGATIDRWFNEATEQRARAELLQMQVDELSEALNQARRMLAYAGKMQ